MTPEAAPRNEMPPLITLHEHGGDWPTFLAAIYQIFCRDFITNAPRFPGKRLGMKRHPVIEGKEATFWHFISEGKIEAERIPNLRRCERIAWPRPMIEALLVLMNGDEQVRCWTQNRQGSKRILIALPDFSYLVVLDDRGDYVLPWTAYVVEHRHQQEKLSREWAAARSRQKAGAAPWEDGPVTPATPGS